MPEGESTHQDIVTIEIRGEQAKEILAELRALFASLQEAAVAAGVQVDASIGQLVVPLQQISTHTGAAVIELVRLREQLMGIGTVAAAPAAAATSLREVGTAARQARYETSLYREEMMAQIYPTAEQPMLYPMQPAGPTPYQPPQPTVMEQWATQAAVGYTPVTPAPPEPELTRWERFRGVLFGASEGLEEIADSSEKAEQASGRFSGSFRRHVVWFAQGTIIYYMISSAIGLVADQIKGAAEEMIAYQDAVARMIYITGTGVGEIDALASSARSLGVLFGQFPAAVMPAMVGTAQATKDVGEQVLYMRDSLHWAYLSGQELEEGLDQLIAVERVWGMEADEGGRILDTVALSYRVAKIPMEEMMATLEKGGRIAESVGLSFDTYAATIAAVGEYSNLTASQVTTLMEAVAARPFQPALAERFEREFGFLDIALFEPGTAGTERRAVAEIIDDLVMQWEHLSAAQRQSVAEIMVGRRLAAEFLTLMEAWQHVPEYVDEYSDALGESNRLTEQLMSTTARQIDTARTAWANLRTEIGLSIDQTIGFRDAALGLGAALEAAARWQRITRGLPAEAPTLPETLEARITQLQELQRGLETRPGPTMAYLQVRGFEGARPPTQAPEVPGVLVLPTVEDTQIWLQQFEDYYREMLQTITPPTRGPDLMGEYKVAQEEAAAFTRTQFSEEMIAREQWAEWQAGGGIDFEQWIQGFDAVTGIMDYTEFTQQQINQAQEESVALVDEMVQAYLLRATILKGEELTWAEINAIMQEVYLWASAQVEVYRDASGELQVIVGQEAAFLDTQLQALEAEKSRFDIQRLRDVGPEQFGGLQQAAWQWQAYLQTIPGYDEEARQFYVVLADNVARPIVTTSTALRYAIEDLTEVEKRQLEGMWNLPAGVTAYVPITSLFYQRQEATGAPGATPMTGPPTGIGGIDTTPVTMAVTDLSGDLMLAGDAATAFAQLMFYAQSNLMMREQELQASILTPARRHEVEQTFEQPWSETFEEEFGYTSRAARQWARPFDNEGGVAPVVSANINLSSNLYLNQTLLAQALQQVQGADLSNAARGYGTRAGGNAPPVMV